MSGRAQDGGVPGRILRRLDDLGRALAGRGDAVALIGLGSVGRDLGRLDEHSDLDFFVVVDDGAKPRYLDSIDWLEQPCPVAFSFANTADGRKALWEDGLFAEYAVFTVGELASIPFEAGRVVWRRDDAPAGLADPGPPPGGAAHDAAFHVGEALTNLYVGLQREARGERLSAARLIQVHAVDRVLELLELESQTAREGRDPFAVERRAEARLGDLVPPLAAFAPGYERNREAALAILDWLERRDGAHPALAAEIRRLASAL